MVDTQTLLFGSDTTERIVAVESQFNKALVFLRENGRVRQQECHFSPWLLTAEPLDIPGANWRELEGEGFRYLAEFSDWEAFRRARFTLRDEHTSHYTVSNAAKQYLVTSGRTLFKGMSYSDVHRMQIDIETLGFTPEPRENAIFLIAISDNQGFERLLDGDEKKMLEDMVTIVRERDPDVIEGHNIFGFDLPYISKRARMHGVQLSLGRDGSEIRAGNERRVPIGGTSKPLLPFYIFGRHIVDTLLAVQRFDVAKGQLSSYGLKECAKAFGIAASDRVYIDHDKIASLWKSAPDQVRRYAMHDVYETRGLSKLVGPPEFFLTQMLPDIYESVVTSGTGEKINSLIVREYLRQGHAIPIPRTATKDVPGESVPESDAGAAD